MEKVRRVGIVERVGRVAEIGKVEESLKSWGRYSQAKNVRFRILRFFALLCM